MLLLNKRPGRKQLSDEELIESIRRNIVRFDRSWLTLANGIVIVVVGASAITLLKQHAFGGPQGFGPDLAGLLLGLFMGSTIGIHLGPMVHGIKAALSDRREHRLLLRYYDSFHILTGKDSQDSQELGLSGCNDPIRARKWGRKHLSDEELIECIRRDIARSDRWRWWIAAAHGIMIILLGIGSAFVLRMLWTLNLNLNLKFSFVFGLAGFLVGLMMGTHFSLFLVQFLIGLAFSDRRDHRLLLRYYDAYRIMAGKDVQDSHKLDQPPA